MERFVGFLEGGPFPGQYNFPDDEIVSWPLPKFIFIEGKVGKQGVYVKYWESTGQPKNDDEARGAKYKWDEMSVGKDMSK